MGKIYDSSIFSIFNFLSNLHILHNGYTILPSHYKVQGFSFLHNLINICYFAFLIIVILQVWSDISLWFWFASPWYLVVILNSCSCQALYYWFQANIIVTLSFSINEWLYIYVFIKKALFKSLTYLKLRLLIFFLVCCRCL